MKKYLLLLSVTLSILTTVGYTHDLKNNHAGKSSPTSCSMNGTYSIGTGGDFPSIKRALDSLKVRGITGNVLFELMANYTSSAETFPIVFPSKLSIPCFSSFNYSITLRPASNATNLQISGAVNEGLVRLDSCNYLTIDGRAGGMGTTRQLSIINNWGTTVTFRNSSNNKLRYVTCITTTQSFTTTFGNIQFSSFNSLFGSNNNLVENCDISLGNGSGPTSLIHSSNGNNAKNFNDSIVNCNLHEFTSWTVYLNDSAIQWKIIGNSFYKQTPLVPQNYVGGDAIIKIEESYDPVGHVISNNYFGGTGPQCTGGQMQVDYNVFDFGIIRGYGHVSISNNYFRRINFTGITDISVINMGISTTSPPHLVSGTISNNQFGGVDPADSINFQNTYTTPNSNYPISAGFISIEGAVQAVANEFNHIRFWAADTTFRIDVKVIQGCYSVRDNIIGNPAVYNSIINNTNGGMLIISDGNVVNNTISNIINTSTLHSTVSNPVIRVIATSSDSVYYNKIFRIINSPGIANSSSQYFTSMVAITAGLAPGNNPNHIVGNTIHSLINNGEGGDIVAIQANGAQVSKNLVHSLFITRPINIYSTIYGIYNNPDSVTNNMILLGQDSAGSLMTLPVIIRGISSGRNVIHNTVAIVGTNVANVPGRFTICYDALNNGSNQANIKNNIFYNTRSNQSAASANRHYCIWINNTSDQSNYNLFYNTGTGAYFGLKNSPLVSYQTFAAWKAGTGKDLNSVYGDPVFINPSGNYNQVDLHLANGTIAEAAGIAGATNTISKDFDNEVRASLTPVDIGADAGNFNSCPVAHAGNDTTICSGNSVQIGVQAIPNFIYNWTSSPVGFTSTLANPVVSPTATTAYYLTLTNASLTCTSRDTIIVSISTATTPTITINTPTTTICAGTSVTFTSIVTNAGTAPVYQWQVNNVNAGTNSPVFTSNSLLNGDQVKCILTSNAACLTTTTAISNIITMVVNASVTASVNISTPNNNICAGTSVTFTAAPTNGGATPTYQWQVNGVNAGTNSNTFTSASLTNNAQVKVILTSSLSCASPAIATSNIITMTVTPAPTAYAGNDTTICSGSSIQLQGSGGTTYLWSPPSGLSNPNIANPVATPLATTAYVLTVSNGGSCNAKDTVLITVMPAVISSINITATSNNICSGTAVTFTATPVNGGTTPIYQWQINGVNAGTNSTTFTSSTLTNNAQVKVILTSSLSCASPANTTSNIISITVVPMPVANAGNDVTICTGGSTQLQGSGGAAGSAYSWSPTAGLSNPNIANPVASPVATIAYSLTVSNGGSCTSNDVVVVTVGQGFTPTVNISTANTSICENSAVTFTCAVTNGGSNPVYQWQVDGVNAGSNSPVFTTSTLSNNSQIKLILTSNLSCVITPTATSNIITINVTQLATPVLSLSNTIFTVINPDAAALYTWQVKNNTVWANVIPTATGVSYTATASGEYRVEAVKGSCTKYSTSQITNFTGGFSHFIDLYPNPAHQYITLDSIALSKKYETVEIIDMHAKRVLPLFSVKNLTRITIDISILSNGIYMAIIRKNDGVYSALKFIKQ